SVDKKRARSAAVLSHRRRLRPMCVQFYGSVVPVTGLECQLSWDRLPANLSPSNTGSTSHYTVLLEIKTTHNKSSTSKSNSSSDDEHRFEERRARSNAKARSTLLPMNMNEEDMQHRVIRLDSSLGIPTRLTLHLS
ncbi:uncharacterized protein LOC125178940, partial [Hyalella azteca]|uniref:Uncharacterized protein LOC125178940 n=1 Tax=Hyalella azteca TaxID=294128 RepID=A0A979FRN5_HYAAZ